MIKVLDIVSFCPMTNATISHQHSLAAISIFLFLAEMLFLAESVVNAAIFMSLKFSKKSASLSEKELNHNGPSLGQ